MLFAFVIAHPYSHLHCIFNLNLFMGVRARLPIEHLPSHSCQKDEDDNSMEKFMVNLKLLGEKQTDAHKNIQQAQATQKKQYDRKHG